MEEIRGMDMDRKWIEKHIEGWTQLYQSMDEQAGFRLDTCASEGALRKTESLAGCSLPNDLREFFLRISSCVELKARIQTSLPASLKIVGDIDFRLSLFGVIQAERFRSEQEKQTKQAVWHNKIGIILTPTHDVIALDKNYHQTHPGVVFIDKATGKCYLLAKDLISFMEIILYIGAWNLKEELFQTLLDSNGINPDCALVNQFYTFFMEQKTIIPQTNQTDKKSNKNISPFMMLCMVFIFCFLIPYVYIQMAKYYDHMLLYASAIFAIVFFIGLIMAWKENSHSISK